MNNLPKLIADIKQTNNHFKGIQEGLITGWSDEMLKIPARGKVKKIEVQYVKNNGEEDRGIQDYWEVQVNAKEDNAVVRF